MGCDYTFIIQVLYGKTWIPIVRFDTKTRCFGHPLSTAIIQAYVREGVCGDVDINNVGIESLEDSDKILAAIGVKEQVTLLTSTESSDVIPKGFDPAEFAKLIESLQKDAEDDSLYYSREQLEKVLPYIDPQLEDSYNAHLYNRMMAPVPLWMEMAKSAHPLSKDDGWIWMYDEQGEIDGFTAKLKEYQAKMVSVYKEMLLLQLSQRGPFPSHLVLLIAEYSSPHASDVRLVWSDCEGQTKKLRRHYLKKKQAATASE